METTTNYQVRILHNEGKGHFFGYDPDTADLYLVHTYEVERQSNGRPEPKNVASQAFFLFNVGDDPLFGTPNPEAVAYRAKRLRSLSVGDVVQVVAPNDGERTFYACASLGWTEVPEADQRDAAPLEANPMYKLAHDVLADEDGEFLLSDGTYGNPGCDACGSYDAVVKEGVSGDYLCAADAVSRNVSVPTPKDEDGEESTTRGA